MTLALSYGMTDVLMSWETFVYFPLSHCSRPLHMWYVVAASTLLLLRSMHCVLEGGDDSQGSRTWCFHAFSRSRSIGLFLMLVVVFPFFSLWTVLGTLWVIELKAEQNCLPTGMALWYYIAWLAVFYLWIIIYVVMIVVSRRNYFALLGSQQAFEALWRQYGNDRSRIPRNLLEPLIEPNGLGPGRILEFPISSVPAGVSDICSVCIEELKAGETIRTLPCSHNFHLECIDYWIADHAYCPNCKVNLRRHRLHRQGS